MSIPDQSRSLIAELIFIVERVTFEHKRTSFERIKRRVLRDDLKRIHKSNFQSINNSNRSSESSLYTTTGLSNYVSITDFKPLEANYSSVKIIDYQTIGIKKDLATTLAKRIEYTSQQLLNKQTFLQNWMIRQQCTEVKPEKYPFSDYANKKISSYNQEALNAVRKFTFTQYLKFNVKKKTGFFSLAQSDPMKYKSTMISSSLTFMKDTDNQKALQAFEYLLKAAGDMQSKYNYLFEINQLIQLVIKGDDNIKEQIFLQVIKQISSKKEVYMKILCCLSYCVKPSTRIYIPLLNFLYEEATLYENHPKQLLNYCFYHTIKNFDQERKNSPCLFQIFCAFHGSKIPIIVNFPKQKVFFVESYTTAEQFLRELIEYYNLDQSIEYLLEINGFLIEKGNLLDKLNYYCELQEQDFKWKDYQNFIGLQAVIVLKNVNDINSSPRCYSIMYNYCANQYLRGLYSLRSTDIVKIAALKMHSEMDDEQNYLFQYKNLISRRKLRMLTNQQRQNYKRHIIKQYFNIRHLTKMEARREILQLLSKSRGFNTHFFRSQIFIEDFDEFVAWVGVQKDKFIIVQPTTGRIMRHISFNKIKQWGKSKSQLCLRVDNIGEFHIDCKQVDVLASVFQSYINYHEQLLKNIN